MVSIENLKNLKYYKFLKKNNFLLLAVSVKNEDEKILRRRIRFN